MSGPGYIGKVATNNSRHVTAVQAQDEREDQYGEMPGEIVDFDPATQTATIKPLYRPRHNGEPVDMPQLLEIPVRFPRLGGFIMTTRVRPGDKVMLRPQMRNTEKYHTEGTHESNDTRSFNLSDYEAFLDGGESLQEPIGGFNSNSLELRTEGGGTKVEIGDDFIFLTIGGSSIRIDGGGITMNAPQINLN